MNTDPYRKFLILLNDFWVSGTQVKPSKKINGSPSIIKLTIALMKPAPLMIALAMDTPNKIKSPVSKAKLTEICF
jgi:hypothetical protein